MIIKVEEVAALSSELFLCQLHRHYCCLSVAAATSGPSHQAQYSKALLKGSLDLIYEALHRDVCLLLLFNNHSIWFIQEYHPSSPWY